MEQQIHAALEQARRLYHAWRAEHAPDRGEQFDAHLATLHMVVDHTVQHKEEAARQEAS